MSASKSLILEEEIREDILNIINKKGIELHLENKNIDTYDLFTFSDKLLLKNAFYIYLQNNNIEELPDITEKNKEGKIINVSEIDLHNNKLKLISNNFIKYFKFRTIILSNNLLNTFPEGLLFDKFSRLKNLDISNNNITELPLNFNTLYLETFRCNNCPIKNIHIISNMVSLYCLFCSNCNMDTFIDISKMRHLRIIDFSFNNLKTLNNIILNKLIKLSEIKLNNNKFISFPTELIFLPYQEGIQHPSGVNINLENNKFEKSCPELKYFKNLTELNLKNCNLTEFPFEIVYLNNIRVLNIEENKINSIPIEINNCRKLEELNCGKNNIKQLYKYNLPKCNLNIKENPIEIIDKKIKINLIIDEDKKYLITKKISK